MNDHVVKYQNSFVFSYLYEDILVEMIEKGLEVSSLLESNIFCFQIDFPDWPAIHSNPETIVAPFNGNIFTLRNFYQELFSECEVNND